MRPRSALLLCPLIYALHAPAALADTRVQSLDQVPGAIKTQDARKLYDAQMSGAPQPDGLGAQLPAGFTEAFLLQQLAPGQNPKRLLVAGAKAWPQRSGSFVALVCLAATAERADRLKKFGGGGGCDNLSRDEDKNEVWLGVFDSVAGGAPKLVAHRRPRHHADRLARHRHRPAHGSGYGGRRHPAIVATTKLETL